MNLKPFVNNKELYEDFLDFLDTAIAKEHKSLEQAIDMATVYRTQGSLFTLRRMKTLKEQVNG